MTIHKTSNNFLKFSEMVQNIMSSKKDAIISLILALISWIPLFNFVTAPLGVFYGIKAIKKIKTHPENYSGKAYAIIGLIMGGMITVFTYSWLALKIAKKI